MKYLIYSITTLFFIFACSPNPENTSTASSKLNTQNLEFIIDSSYNLLVEKEIEPPGLSYDTADFAIVQFPNDDRGVFVTIGVFGIARGYQLLYRIENEQLELIEPIRTDRYVWGLRSAQDNKRPSAQVDIEFLDILAPQSNEWQDIVKVTGAGHAGTGLWDDGYFEILAVTDDGLKELFRGIEFSTNSTTLDSYHEYQFTDLDEDGTQEIVEAIEECEYRISKETWEREDLGCQQSQKVYRFNGMYYVPE